MSDREPYDGPRTEPAETVALTEHLVDLRAALEGGADVPAGRLLGLPELPDGDVWVDAAGAAALAGVEPRTITGWLARAQPRACPFPPPVRVLYRNYWPRSAVLDWRTAYQQEISR